MSKLIHLDKPTQVDKYQIRIRSQEPVEIDNVDPLSGWTYKDVMARLFVQVHRASYMVNAPNRWVWWAVDKWDYNKHEWVCLHNGKSRVRADAKPL